MKNKFSKETMIDHLSEKKHQLEKKWKFDPNNGWSQIDMSGDRERIIAYAQYEVYQDLIEDISEGNI